jgi:hypothetical protein
MHFLPADELLLELMCDAGAVVLLLMLDQKSHGSKILASM